MAEITNSAINYHAYNLHDGDTLMNQVAKVICVLLPRGLIAAGFSEQGDLLMIRYCDYSKTLPTWILDFYEHRFIEEPLLARPKNVIATFVASDKYMVVPEAVYDEHESEKWFRKIFFIEANEVISEQRLNEDKARYLYAYPETMKRITGRYFINSKLLPLAICQFFKPHNGSSALQCCITGEHAYATMYKDRTLQWHQVFGYENGEDIAYQIKLLCKEHQVNTDTLDLHVTDTYRGLNPVLNTVSQYFPNMKDSDAHVVADNKQWAPAIGLLQQLYACAL